MTHPFVMSLVPRGRSLAFLSLVVVSLGTATAGEIKTRTATIPPPQEVPTGDHGIVTLDEQTLALRQQDLARREKELEKHHRRLPIPEAKKRIQLLRFEPEMILPTPLNFSGSPIKILQDRPLTMRETGGEVSIRCEPSVAVRGDEVLVTGNWFAAFSTDATSSISKFKAVDPSRLFPAPASKLKFCCDQLALYDPKTDAMFWLLQYEYNAEGNLLRLAVAKKDDIKNQKWRYYDLSPKGVGQYKNETFDFSACALGTKFLYVTTNSFSTLGKEPFMRSVAMRIPLDKLAAYEGFDLEYFDTKDLDDAKASGLCPVQGATNTMYVGAEVDTQTLRIYTWSEATGTVASNDVIVRTWDSRQPFEAPSPQGGDWLGRADDRITAGWLSGDTIGFAWTASRDVNFRFPHVRVAVLNKDTKELVEEPHIYSRDFAYAYPAAAPNSIGEVAITVNFGGDSVNPSCAIGVLRKQGNAKNRWILATSAAGKAFPPDKKWGDYLTLRLDGKNPRNWVTASFVRENNGTTQVGYQVFGLK